MPWEVTPALIKTPKMKYLYFCIFIITNFTLNAQVTLQEELEVSNFMSKYSEKNGQSSSVKAWKIQIITTNERRDMEKAISEFHQYFPDYETNWFHENPYYKVKVGAFETKEDLFAFLLAVKQYFPGAIPVVDDIEKSELVKP